MPGNRVYKKRPPVGQPFFVDIPDRNLAPVRSGFYAFDIRQDTSAVLAHD